jgi:anti-anti-sigma regulatory factor
MLHLNVERIGRVTVIHCTGRIVRSDAAFRLRDAVRQQRDARFVLLDLSEVDALEGGGLGMLLFLQVWTRDRGIQLKLFDLPACVRQSLERARYAPAVEIAAMGEVRSLLSFGAEEVWDRSRRGALSTQ